jgi:hypothetical protein
MSKLILLCLCAASLGAQAPDPWKDLGFLLGEWTGEGGGSPGQAMGAYSFLPELGGKILVRRNVADYPAAGGKPAVHHEDVMTVYREAGNQPPAAIYFDSEGHVIHYSVEIDAAAKLVRFVSPTVPNQPRYRLTYRETGKNLVAGKFEIAAPDKPEAFATYLDWISRRR